MIVTVTANPSIDRTIQLEGPLTRGAVLRAASVTDQPGGKGINVARVVTGAGLDALALLPARTGDPLLTRLDAAGLPYRTVELDDDVRTNITLAEPDGTTTKVNEPGAALTADRIDALADLVLDAAAGARWVALCGSIPPGMHDDWYAVLTDRLHRAGLQVAADTSGAPLAALGEARADLLKPNAVELAGLTGQDGDAMEAAAAAGDPAPAAAAAQALADRTGGEVLTTLGGAGALLTTPDGTWQAFAPPVTVRSTVGAGDSSLAGYLIASLRGDGPDERLRTAVAYGSAAAALPGTTPPDPHHLDLAGTTVRRLS
ncbi:MAG: hexose kinase [Gordonia sp. (in: high G+C Gram-positive bacteria)]|uniref:1-phosphofructokinase family hexose kinase n=1 Tax=Gordonia sp. (in: high G+C Gram-positive bacteria) TaxID=84139 RepID=UPI0039E6544A